MHTRLRGSPRAQEGHNEKIRVRPSERWGNGGGEKAGEETEGQEDPADHSWSSDPASEPKPRSHARRTGASRGEPGTRSPSGERPMVEKPNGKRGRPRQRDQPGRTM
ncbi:hypothetical protein NDU88_001651 [Pleurodeles waltl]|uniref:Uncharacterized protein n=1 Tax=Pleurodeles waltl TaxID=8319 RepID=A0AAV7V928_PLEWA|nr:hypothetical protein NDU88_001651 [Pleurodeles waltl]